MLIREGTLHSNSDSKPEELLEDVLDESVLRGSEIPLWIDSMVSPVT